MPQDYTFKFVAELVGSQNLSDLVGFVQGVARSTKEASENAALWGKALEVAAKANNISVRDLTASIKRAADEQKKAADQAKKDAKERADEDEKSAKRSMDAADRLNRYRIQLLRNTQAMEDRARREQESKRYDIRNEISGLGGGSGIGGSLASRGESIFGRVGGRVIGAEVLGRAAGIPGGGFIGSQVVGGLGLSGGAALALGGTAVAGLAAYGLVKAADDTAKYAQAQQNLAKEIGTTVQETQLLGRISEVTGVQTEGLFSVLKKMNVELTAGGSESRKIKAALEELGLSAAVAFQKPTEQLQSVLKAFRSVSDEQERGRIAVRLFGESGRLLLPLVDNFDRVSDAVKKTNVILDEATTKRMAAFKERTEEISLAWESFKHKLAEGAVGVIDFVIKGGKSVGEAVLGGQQIYKGKDGSIYGVRKDGVVVNYDLTEPTANIPSGLDKYQADSRLNNINRARREGLSTVEGMRVDLKDIEDRRETALNQYGSTGDEKYLSQAKSLSAQHLSQERAIKEQIEFEHKQEEYTKLIAQPIGSYKEGNDRLIRLAKEFPGFPVPQELRLMALDYAANEAAKVGEQEYQKTPSVYKLIEGIGKIEHNRVLRVEEATPQQREADRIQNDITGLRVGLINSQYGGEAVAAAQRTALLTGQSRYGLTASQLSRMDLSESISAITGQLGPQTRALRARAGAYTEAAGATGISDEQRFKYQQEAAAALAEAEDKETEARTRAIESVNKFNDSIDKVAEAMRNEFASGFESILLGAQNGGLRGQAGKGVLDAIRGFGEKIEGQLLHNVGAHIYGDPSQGTGVSGSIAKVTKTLGLPDWLTSGTILGQVDQKKDPVAVAGLITSDADRNAAKIVAAINGLRGGSGGGTGSGGDSSVNPLGDASDSGDPVTASSIAGSVPGAAGATAAIAAAVRSGNPRAISAALSAVGRIGKSLATGFSHAGNWDAITGNYGTPGVDGQPGTAETGLQQAGAIIGTAALGVAAYEGIRTMAQGGAKNVAGGLAGTLGAVAPLTGPAAPFVEAAAATAALVSAFLPDLRAARGAEISKRIFTQQYLAPPSENITSSGNGGYADFDIYGGVRNSHFSPYPITAGSYLDVPRRTVVPGGTLSTFGGSGILSGTGAQRPQVPTPIIVHMTVNAMDSKSIVDHSNDIANSLHHALLNGHETVVHTLGQHLGLR